MKIKLRSIRRTLLTSLFVGLILAITPVQVLGHGLTAETLPTFKIGEREIAFFAKLLPNTSIGVKQIGMALFEPKTNLPIQETTYLVKLIKNNDIIFEEIFQIENSILLIDLIPIDSDKTIVEETSDMTEIESSFGIDKKVRVSNMVFNENGLYLFEVKILTYDSFENKLENPIIYNLGLSIPDILNLDIKDENLKNHQLQLISYYDKIYNFDYDSENNLFNFAIPFDWKEDTINQTSVVHQEFIFPKDFDYLMNANFSAYVNDIKFEDRILIIDDSWADKRVIHLMINQNDLTQLVSKQIENQNKMEFKLIPFNSQKINLNEILIPDWIRINAQWWSQDQINDDTFIQGIQYLIKEEIMMIPGPQKGTGSSSDEIPSWIKNNAGWWAQGLISDDDFVKGIQYLVEQGIISV